MNELLLKKRRKKTCLVTLYFSQKRHYLQKALQYFKAIHSIIYKIASLLNGGGTLTLIYKDVSIRRNRWFTISNKMLYAHQKVQSHAL